MEFLDEKTKKKKIVSIYSPYEELKLFGLRFQNKDASIYKYTIDLLQGEKMIKSTSRKEFFSIKMKLLNKLRNNMIKKTLFLSEIMEN